MSRFSETVHKRLVPHDTVSWIVPVDRCSSLHAKDWLGSGPICRDPRSPRRIGTTRSNSQEPLSSRRILLVEDESVIAMEIERWLRGAGAHLIRPVSNLEHALDRSKPDELEAVMDL